ncbi:Putative RxLR effector [Phytophthora palmivora]|uniref:RxLR effector n=1 Tax=Phytophthora palmivora TaxID=4796 RepID=A0A2P4Y1G5_9STRA|nr:Putative RxLR effector [Phytophthora palmivora]
MKANFAMHQLCLLLLILVRFIICTNSAALTKDTTTGWSDESQINTDHTTLQDSRPYRKLEGRVTSETEHENDEERGGLKWFMKKPASPTVVAKVVQESPEITKVIKANPGISQTVGKLQKDKDLLKEIQSTPMFSRMQGLFRKNPSKKLLKPTSRNWGWSR